MTTTTTTAASTVTTAIFAVPSFAMFHGKRDKQLLCSLFVAGKDYDRDYFWGVLEGVNFDYASNMAKLEVEVLTDGIKLTKQTASKHPLARKPEERIGAWLDRCANNEKCSGITVVIPVHLLTVEQVSDMYNHLDAPKYGAENTNSLVAQFVAGELKPVPAPVVVNPDAIAEAIGYYYGMTKTDVSRAYEAAIGSSRGWTKAEMVGKLVARKLAS